jgi:hypothetical protein
LESPLLPSASPDHRSTSQSYFSALM